MNPMDANSTGLQSGVTARANAAGFTYAQVTRDPQLMDALIRDAHRARSEAIFRMLAAAVGALWNGARGLVRAGWNLASGAARQTHAALNKANPPVRPC